MDTKAAINLIPYDAAYALNTVQMWRASMEAALGITDTHSWDEQLDYLQQIAAHHQVYLALEEGTNQVVGLLAVEGSELDQLYIHVDYQGLGIGTRLLTLAKELSPGTLQLYTFAVNQRAQRFYEKHGFTIIARGVEQQSGMADIRYEWVREQPPMSPERNDARTIHQETAAAWQIVAQSGYSGDIAEDVAFIQQGGNSLLAPEQQLLQGLAQWCECALQLQCSGGRDLLSIWRMGAKRIIGVDISATLIGYATQKAAALQAPATWVCCDILDTPHSLNGSADLVYTGRGALMWMMDIDAWAAVVARLLRPHGRVLIYEGHPLDNLWDREADSLMLRPDVVSYFPTAPHENPGFPSSVVSRETPAEAPRPKMVERHWRPSEVINALTRVGLRYLHFEEYPVLFWNQFPNLPPATAARLPHTYSVLMEKVSPDKVTR